MERFSQSGTLDEVMKHKGPDTKIIDLGGRTMLPGFVDAHGHMFIGGLQALSANFAGASRWHRHGHCVAPAGDPGLDCSQQGSGRTVSA